jgi:outer membrane receptor protein involved in Fe transport
MERLAERICLSKVWPVAAAISLVCAPAAARDPSLLEEIQVTATRERAASHDVSQGVTLVRRDELAWHTPLTVVDHLRGEPGTYVQQTTPGQGIPVVRGLKGSEVLHLVDGFRLNNAIFRNAPNQYVALVDAWNLERIEVVRGPGAAFHGAEAMGGVVQFLTRAPHFEGRQVQLRGNAGAQWGSVDSRFASQVEAEVGNERWLAQLGGTHQDTENMRAGNGETLPHTAFRAQGAHARLAFAPAADLRFTLQAQYTAQPQTPRVDALVPGFGQSRPDFSEHLFRPQRREFVQLRAESERASTWADTADVQIGAQRMIDDRLTRDFEAPYREAERNSSTLFGAIGHFTKQLSTGGGANHALSYGFEVYHDSVDSSRERIRLADGAATPRPSRFPDGSTMSWVGVYVADRWSPRDWIDVTGGLRYTSYDIELPANVDGTDVAMRPDDVSGNLGLVVRTSDALNLVANVGRGFRAPNVFDLGTFGARGNRFSIPNPELDPESVVTCDLGLKYASGTWQAELFAFRSHYRDKITQVLTGDTDMAGRLVVQSRNATRLTLHGLEAGVTWHPSERASVSATATWTRGEEALAGDSYPADRVPPFFGRVGARFDLSATLAVEPSIYWAATQSRLSPRDATDPRMNPDGTAGWASATIRAAWNPTRSFTAYLGVENLADHRYREHGSGFDAPGRNAFVSVAFSF